MEGVDALVGASTGTLKSISLAGNDFTNLLAVKELNPKQDEITSMIWADDEQTTLLTAHMDRSLKLFDSSPDGQQFLFSVEGGSGAIKGLHRTSSDKIVTCVESGDAKVFTKNGKELKSWNAGEGVTCMHGDNTSNTVVTGGEKNLIKVWDIESGAKTWYAKNVPLDKLQLDVPIKCTDVKFVLGENTIVEATKLHELRLYDPRAQRRPVNRIPFMEEPITTISLCYRPNHVLAANAIGEIGLFDLRSKVHPVCKFKGQAGSIRSIDAHPTAPLFVSCGIDRFVRVHDIESKKLVHKIYCKTRLNKVLLRRDLSILKPVKTEWDDIKEEAESDEDVEDEDSDFDSESEEDDVWNQFDVKKQSTKRKEQISEDDKSEEVKPKKKKLVPSRKRKETETSDDEITEIPEPPKKARLKSEKTKNKNGLKTVEPEIKEEVISDDDAPAPKKRKLKKK